MNLFRDRDIYDIEVDKSNTTWFATDEGLVKYENGEWTKYTSSNSDLPHNNITSIETDSYNNKWMFAVADSYWSQWLVNYDDTNFNSISLLISEVGVNFGPILAIDDLDNIWFGLNAGERALPMLIMYNHTVYAVKHNFGVHSSISNITAESNNKIWVSVAGNGPAFGVFSSNRFIEYSPYSEIKPYWNFRFEPENCTIDAFGNKWICSQGDLFVFNENGIRFTTDAVTCKSLQLSDTYLPDSNSTLIVKGEIDNPSNKLLDVSAYINGIESIFHDTLKLYDDELHGDDGFQDNIYAGSRYYQTLEEGNYSVTLSAVEEETGEEHFLFYDEHFTTAGPVVIESYTLDEREDEGRVIFISDIILRNYGVLKTIRDVTYYVYSLDPNIGELGIDSSPFGCCDEIPPGEAARCGQYFYIRVDYPAEEVKFELEIGSEGIYYWKDTLVVAIPTDIEINSDLPTKFALQQNYPNPFNPTTSIKYSLPAVGTGHAPSVQTVKLVVYDVLGKEVATLVNKHQRPGSYTVNFDASGLSSGIYFYKLSAGKFIKTRKMVLLR
jgi:hypothetical protein